MARKIEVQIVGNAASLERAFGRAKVSSRGLVGSLESAGGALASIGKKVAIVGAALTAGGIGAAKFGASFQEQMQKIVGLSGVSQSAVDKLSKQVLALAPSVGKSPQELAKALFFITSSGIAASKSLDVLTNSAKASVAGLGDTVVVADAVTSAINAYGAANITAKHATDILVAAVREGKGEADAIAGSIGNVAALAAQLGVKFNDVAAALASETRLGIDAETASVQLQQVFSNLIKVAPQAEKAFKSVGLSSAGLRQELADKGLIATLTTIKQAFGDNLPALSKAFPNIRALRGVLALIGKDAAETQGVFARLTDTSTSLKTAFDAVSTDTAQQFRKLKASAEVAGIAIGAAFAPLAGVVAGALAKAADKLAAFVGDFSAARTLHAKLSVVWEGVQGATKSAEAALKKAADAVDWKKVWAGARALADGLQAQLESIDWSGVGKAIGDGIAKGVSQAAGVAKALANRIEEAFRAIDFNALGRAAGPGLAAAVLSAFATLLDPAFWLKNWDLALSIAAVAFGDGIGRFGVKLLLPLRRVLSETFLKGIFALAETAPRLANVLLRVGELGAAALARGLNKAGDLVGRVFARLANTVGRPLGFVVKVLGLQAAIDAIARAFRQIAQTIRHALDGAFNFLKIKSLKAALDIIEPFSHLPKKLGGGPFQQMKKELQQKLKEMQSDGAAQGTAVGAAITKGLVDGLQNFTPVDQAAEAAMKAAVGKARTAAEQVTKAAATQTPPRSVSVTDTATAAPTTATPARKGITADQRNTWFDDAITRMLDRIQDLPTIKAQIAKLQDISKLISDRIKVTRDITRKLTLEDQLVNVRRQIKPLAQQAQDASQFFTLGLGPTGEERTPLVSTLQRQLKNVSASVEGTFLDTSKTRSVLANIAKVLRAGVGNVSQTVRAQIKQMLDGINQQLKDNASRLPQHARANQAALLKGLGLAPDQVRALRSRLSQVGVGGTVLTGLAPIPRTGLAAAGGGTVEHTTIVTLDKQVLGRAVTKHQQQTKTRNPDQRRGIFGGG